MSKPSLKELKPLVKLFFGQATSFHETSRNRFQAEYRISSYMATNLIPKGKWRRLRDKWALERIRTALDEVFKCSPCREEFTVEQVLRQLRETGICRSLFLRLARKKWCELTQRLPTRKEKILKCIKELVAKQILPEKLTYSLIFETAGITNSLRPWLKDAVLAAKRELVQRQITILPTLPPPGVNALILPTGWIDLDRDVWDLRAGAGSCLKKELIRTDIAQIAWPQMREALLEQHLTCGTVSWHYLGYRWAGELLGKDVPDVRKATLEQIQTAWLKYNAKGTKLETARAALRRIFTYLCNPNQITSKARLKEMLLISGWLYASATVCKDSPNQDFLSEEEINKVITGCLSDIKAGLDFTEQNPDLLSLSTRRGARGNVSVNAAIVVHWSASLILLLMLFTGLRCQSVLNLKVGDWAEIRPGLFALIWSHGKKREEKVAILATSIALLLDQYVQRTETVRKALGTSKLFLTATLTGYWGTLQSDSTMRVMFATFIKRHDILRDGNPLKLHSLILRRTYVTRELYLGRSIWALRLQLGHEQLRSTRRYGKFDLFEHPAEVGTALDDYGRRTLKLWNHPVLLADLNSSERARLLGVSLERHQDVGLCRFDLCRQSQEGNPPPCSLCEHLVSGPAFIEAWEIERRDREREIERLRALPQAEHILALRRIEYERFLLNLAYVKGEVESEQNQKNRVDH